MNLEGEVDWSALPAPSRGLRCTVILPARNEAALLPRALQALAAQEGVAFGFEVIVLANNCTDDTAAKARQFADPCGACAMHVVEVTWPVALASVGRARRALWDVAAQRVQQSGVLKGIVLSTDADTRVAPDWLAATAAAIDAGADAVGGRIVAEVDDTLPPSAQRLMRLDDAYRTWRARLECLVDPDPADPWPRHHQHFGASLAVTAQAYRAVGGQPLVPFLEDEALVRALRLEDKALRHCPRVQVHTSARLDGRAEVGLSWQLRAWSTHPPGDGCPAVTAPGLDAHQWALRRRVRKLWHETNAARRWATSTARLGDATAGLADDLRMDRRWLAECAAEVSSFGRLWDGIGRYCGPAMTASAHANPTLPMDEALRQLRRMVQAQRVLLEV